MVQNHDWLLRLQQRGARKIAQAAGMGGVNLSSGSGGGGGEGDAGGQEEEDRELLGWKTRLIERAGSGVHTAVNISSSSNPAGSVPQRTPSPDPLTQNGGGNSGITPAMHLLQQHFVPPFQSPPVSGMLGTTAQTLGMDNSTDLLVSKSFCFYIPSDFQGSNKLTKLRATATSVLESNDDG